MIKSITKLNKNIIFQKIGTDYIGFDFRRSTIFTFNETAELILKYILRGYDEDHIIKALQKKYLVSQSMASKDIKKIFDYLKKHSILLSRKTESI